MCIRDRHRGFAVINSAECHDICSDKWMNQIIFERHKIDTPKTVRVLHSEGSEKALEELDSDFPIILKTGSGSRGVGVILVESAASCQSIVQLLYRENEFIDIILQEKLPTKYDVRVIICGEEIIGVIDTPNKKYVHDIKEMTSRLKIPYDIVSDQDLLFSSAFGVPFNTGSEILNGNGIVFSLEPKTGSITKKCIK